jgi:nicotinate-nucleotide adenylyltransferase
MRLGIFGGTFDPVHLAHLRCAEEAREALQLDRVLFIPAASPPHKPGRQLAAAAHRLTMVRLSIAGNRAFRVSSMEIDRSGRSYSVDTLRLLRQQLPASTELVFLLGVDAFREIHTWKEYRSLFALADLAVFSRPPRRISSLRGLLPVAARGEFCYEKNQQTLRHASGSRVRFLRLTALDISASAIRQRVERGQSIRYLVPAAVERYIHRHRLYARGNTPS